MAADRDLPEHRLGQHVQGGGRLNYLVLAAGPIGELHAATGIPGGGGGPAGHSAGADPGAGQAEGGEESEITFSFPQGRQD